MGFLSAKATRLPWVTVTMASGRRAAVDAVCADAMDLARDALRVITDDTTVGRHLGVEADDERVVTHLFEAELPGYRGWRWAVTVARASRGRSVTVDEAVLLPGPDSLLPPAWVPWTERLRPGDLGVGDLLPTDEDDEWLEPGWNASEPAEGHDLIDVDDELAFAEVIAALDLTRPRVLSPIGIDDAIDRWLSGPHGPESEMAQAAPATCATCGFRLPITGLIGQGFGVCANEIAPSDGHVVALDFGCGAHSEAVVVPAMSTVTSPVIDEVGYDVFEGGAAAPSSEDIVVTEGHTEGTVRDDDPGEDLGHG